LSLSFMLDNRTNSGYNRALTCSGMNCRKAIAVLWASACLCLASCISSRNVFCGDPSLRGRFGEVEADLLLRADLGEDNPCKGRMLDELALELFALVMVGIACEQFDFSAPRGVAGGVGCGVLSPLKFRGVSAGEMASNANATTFC
jgi:hypothetical protein